MELRTERLLLRSVSLAEASYLRERKRVPGWPVCPTYPVYRTPQAAGRVADGLAEPDGLGLFVISRTDDHQQIGDISAERGRIRTDTVWMFIEIAEASQGRRYGSEALLALSSWAIMQKGVERVRADILASNVASQHMALRAGYRQSQDPQVWEWQRSEPLNAA